MSKPFNVKGKGRHYKSPVTGNNLPSVTNILDCYPKQRALVPWAANMQKELDVEAAWTVYQSRKEFRDADHFRQVLDDFIGKQRKHKAELAKAGDLGTKVHKAIDCTIRASMGLPAEEPPTLEGPALWAYMSWEDWWRQTDIQPRAVEKFVFSDKWGYAGTTDLIADVRLSEALYKRLKPEFRDNLRTMLHLGEVAPMVIDVKTGKGVYPDMLLQLAAYLEAAIEIGELKEKVDPWGMILRLPKNEKDPEFEVRFLRPEHRRQKLETFLAVKKVWEDMHNVNQ